MARAICAVVCLTLLGVFAPVRESVAAPKIDLEEYLGEVPLEGDTHVAVSEADERTATILAVGRTSKTTGVTTELREASSDVVENDFDVIYRGKDRRVGTISLSDGNSVITFFTPFPKRLVRFKMKQNKAYKYNIPARIFVDGAKAGKSKNKGTITFLGFEEVTTPLGTFPDAAHLLRIDSFKVKIPKTLFETRTRTESWVVPVLGTVRFIESSEFLENKVSTDVEPPVEWLLDHGIAQGEPFPAEAP